LLPRQHAGHQLADFSIALFHFAFLIFDHYTASDGTCSRRDGCNLAWYALSLQRKRSHWEARRLQCHFLERQENQLPGVSRCSSCRNANRTSFLLLFSQIWPHGIYHRSR
jgi:hypothetical protein